MGASVSVWKGEGGGRTKRSRIRTLVKEREGLLELCMPRASVLLKIYVVSLEYVPEICSVSRPASASAL